MIENDTSSRVLEIEEILALRQAARANGQKIVLTNGCFDLLHRGHLSYLQASAALGDFLIVAVNSDASIRELKGPDRPLNTAADRAYALASLRCVAAAFIFPGPRLAAEIVAIEPDIYTKAGDYTLATLEPTERTALESVGTQISFIPFLAGHSTTALIDRAAQR
jgi:D-glycero-beta-D-manno-heptose 1-phosphate adenylyltransferase